MARNIRKLTFVCPKPNYFIAWKLAGGRQDVFKGGATVTIELTPPPPDKKKTGRRKAR